MHYLFFRAQNDGEYRKAKNESKNLQEIINHQKKVTNNSPNLNFFGSNVKKVASDQLHTEIATLKESYKLLEEKYLVN